MRPLVKYISINVFNLIRKKKVCQYTVLILCRYDAIFFFFLSFVERKIYAQTSVSQHNECIGFETKLRFSRIQETRTQMKPFPELQIETLRLSNFWERLYRLFFCIISFAVFFFFTDKYLQVSTLRGFLSVSFLTLYGNLASCSHRYRVSSVKPARRYDIISRALLALEEINRDGIVITSRRKIVVTISARRVSSLDCPFLNNCENCPIPL